MRELTRRGVRVVLDTEGEPLRLGLEAEPWLVSPNQREAEQLVGQELEDEADFLMALDAIAEMGARNVHITLESGCFALVREERHVKRLRALSPQLEPVSTVGAGDVLLAQWLAAQLDGKPADEALRLASPRARRRCSWPAPAASTRKEAGRLAALVEIDELTPAAVERPPRARPRRRSGRRGRSVGVDRSGGTIARLLEFELDRDSKFGKEGLTFDDVLLCRPSRPCFRTTSRRPRG